MGICNRMKTLALLLSCCCLSQMAAMDLQSVLDRGDALELEPGRTYIIEQPLVVRQPNQIITTTGATPGDLARYATLRLAPGANQKLLEGRGARALVLSQVIFDGNRTQFQPPNGKGEQIELISMGGTSGDNSRMEHCVVLNARCAKGMAAVHVFEGCSNVTVADNVIFGAGTDVLGNGRNLAEKDFGLGDGISISSFESVVRNNLIIDATDEGIMVHSAIGCLVEDNVVVSHSRETLAGIGIFSGMRFNKMDKPGRYNYERVIVQNNLIDAYGGRMHMGITVGGPAWSERNLGKYIVGATVRDNRISGQAGAYGIVVNGAEDCTITGNVSTATYSGRADGDWKNKTPPDDPGAFLFEPEHTINCTLQPDFKPAERNLVHMTRNYRFKAYPLNEEGCRIVDHETPEAEAIITAAYHDVLQQEPSADNLLHWAQWLKDQQANADDLRLQLTKNMDANQLSTHLTQQFLAKLTSALSQSPNQWPAATDLHAQLYNH